MINTKLAALFVAATLMIGTVSPYAFADPIWNVIVGDGVTVTDADQADGIASFEYATTNRGETSWNFGTTATEAGTITLQYDWTGYHGYFGASTRLYSLAGQVGSSLVVEGPVSNGSSPAGGFSYTGTVIFNLVAGERYGFGLSGDSGDTDNRILGTFIVTDVTPAIDADNDGYFANTEPLDCNDNDSTIYPGAIEIVGDGIDQDCDGVDTIPIDADFDGFFPDVDCNDNDNAIYPGAPEIIGDSIDQDCDGFSDEGESTALIQQITDLMANNTSLQINNTALTNQVTTLNGTIIGLEGIITTLQETITTLENTIADINKTLATLPDKIINSLISTVNSLISSEMINEYDGEEFLYTLDEASYSIQEGNENACDSVEAFVDEINYLIEIDELDVLTAQSLLDDANTFLTTCPVYPDEDDNHDNKGKGHDKHKDKENGKGHEKYDHYDDDYDDDD